MVGENEIKRIGVIEPGMMGHPIAQEFAVAGYEVTLCGRNEKRLEEAHVKIEESLNELARWELISATEVDSALDRLTTTTDLEATGAQADFIVESIVEVLEVKKDLFEIVRGKDTSDEIVNVIYELYEGMGKSPIICQKTL